MTSNEIRQVIGMKPSSDPNADVLRNKNLSASADEKQAMLPAGSGPGSEETNKDKENGQNGKEV